MRRIFVFLALSLPFFSSAETIIANYYSVTSDTFDASLNPGSCVVTGKVTDTNADLIAGGLISNFDRSRFCYTAADGTYTLTLSSLDTAIFFYHENYGEIIIWNYAFQSQHRVSIDFFAMEYTEYPVIQEKPVIYLYAEKPTTVNLSLNHSELTFTYPAYENGWEVTTNNAGGITDTKSGKTHPYLFWEGKTDKLSFIAENNVVKGNLVETKNCISFLENALSVLGFNSTEATDFITYWAPRLQQKDYAFVQFLIDEEVDEHIAELTVTPEPESRRRVYMLFTPLDQAFVPVPWEVQQLTPFERTGLTLLEWGGSELTLNSLFP